MVKAYIWNITEIKLNQNNFVSVLFQFYFRCNHCIKGKFNGEYLRNETPHRQLTQERHWKLQRVPTLSWTLVHKNAEEYIGPSFYGKFCKLNNFHCQVSHTEIIKRNLTCPFRLSSPVMPNGYTLKRSGPYWSNPSFLLFWHSGMHSGAQDWAPQCQNVSMALNALVDSFLSQLG